MAAQKTTSKAKTARSTGASKTKTKTGQGEEIVQPVMKAGGRVDAFRDLARRIADGAEIVPPRMLTGLDRRHHVRSTLREDHQTRIEAESPGARHKFRKLSESRFKFFRGTQLLFYRDMVGTDAHMPTVLALGDVHPENFGVMPNKDGVPIFSVNDFDEAIYAPFTWDLKRAAVGFWVAAKEEGDLSRKQRRKIVKAFVKGYLEAMELFASKETEKSDAFRMDNSPKVIRRLFEEAWEERKDWLWDDYLKPSGKGFRADDELQPISSEIPRFQQAVNDLAKANKLDVPDRSPELRVKDVCVRHGQGTSSLGLPRFYVLLEGPSKDATDDIIVEFKKARRSALSGLTPPTQFDAGEKGDRVAHGQQVQLAHGDVFFGAVEIWGESYMSRERAPFRDDIDLDELSKKTWRAYAHVCGRALAQAHALSDDLGQVDYDVEPSIVAACEPRKLFVDDLIRFTVETADRLKHDHQAFIEDFKEGAFDSIDMIYR
ncbi:hypothetical protein FIU97_10450 [Roseivivax sp. THAF40]|uniref:DUF2252 domain-containing protein n=1 Tax=unclassified Roseivivax TaxID=2639302 RepID=UPI0012679099|nr:MULTISPECIES: DUF2252 family protein [unclassified Roseivivax]QFS83247.1 hypothetical protein FIV09_10465 [Roseivivax sp. THAF197b]QFT46991.1 hypothetical protein FIU97_10450 [Roseivivax sp. THAF40]